MAHVYLLPAEMEFGSFQREKRREWHEVIFKWVGFLPRPFISHRSMAPKASARPAQALAQVSHVAVLYGTTVPVISDARSFLMDKPTAINTSSCKIHSRTRTCLVVRLTVYAIQANEFSSPCSR